MGASAPYAISLCALLLGALAVTPESTAQSPLSRQLEFVCGTDQGAIPRVNGDNVEIHGCPVRLMDGQDNMGNIDLLVDPDDPAKSAFVTLHGSFSSNGASSQSRTGQKHSLFQSHCEGSNWWDNPSGSTYPDVGGATGEEAAIAMDHEKNTYFAYVYGRNAAEEFAGFARIFKAKPVAEGSGYCGTSSGQPPLAATVESVYTNAAGRVQFGPDREDYRMVEFNLIHMAAPTPPNATKIAPGRMFATWFEYKDPDGVTTEARQGWVGAAWHSDDRANTAENWMHLKPQNSIGPCLSIGNPVVWDDRLYLACTVSDNYTAREGANWGDVDVWSLDPVTGTTRLEANTGIEGFRPRLAVNDEGYMAVIASRALSSEVSVQVAFGWYGWFWHVPHEDLGPDFHARLGNHQVSFAHITGIAMSNEQPTLFVVYKERNSFSTIPSVPDPSNPQVRKGNYKKVIFSLDECEAPIASGEFTIGAGVDTYQDDALNSNPGAFNDRRDGFQLALHPTTGEERIYFAVDDYGVAQIGGVRVASGYPETPCEPMRPPPPPPPPPPPTETPITSAPVIPPPEPAPPPNAVPDDIGIPLNAPVEAPVAAPVAPPAPNSAALGFAVGLPLAGMLLFIAKTRTKIPQLVPIRNR